MSELPVLSRLRENAQRIDDVIAQLEPVLAAFLTSPQGQNISSGNETRAIFEQSDFTDQYFLTLTGNSEREEIVVAVSVGGAVRLQSSTADVSMAPENPASWAP